MGGIPVMANKKAGPVSIFQVHPQLWKLALILADNDPHRIEILGTRELLIHNHPIKTRI
jgi:hypothetical protein